MPRLIDADALDAYLEKHHCDDWMLNQYNADWIASWIESQPTIEAVPVKHGRWIFINKHLWCKDEDGNVDEWEWDAGFHNGPECQVCHATPCVHCTPNWAETECEKGHYYCSECGETSKDAHENYCPNCGAKMEGGADNERS